MKRVCFAVHTEYHLLFALKVICAFHNRGKERITIYRLSPFNTKRLNQDLHFEDTNIEYQQIRYSNKRYRDKRLRYDLDKMANQRPEVLYIFNESQKVFPYLFKKLKKCGTKIILCPDGVGAFSNYTPIKERIIQYVFDNLYLWTNQIPSYLPFPKKHYAYRKGIDAVVVENAKSYNNYTNKEIIELTCNNYSKEEFCFLSNHVFGYRKECCDISPGSILWIDQPVEGMEESKRKFLFELHVRYPQKRIFFKPHPHSFLSEIELYSKNDAFTIININMPVELMMENLDNVFIFGAYSASLYYYNPNCYYYWVAALFRELPKRYHTKVPFEHINVITDFNQIDLQ